MKLEAASWIERKHKGKVGGFQSIDMMMNVVQKVQKAKLGMGQYGRVKSDNPVLHIGVEFGKNGVLLPEIADRLCNQKVGENPKIMIVFGDPETGRQVWIEIINDQEAASRPA